MDRNGEDWTGDDIAAEAAGQGARAAGPGNRADARPNSEEAAPRKRSVATSGADGVRMNDDGEANATTAGSGNGESD